MSVIKIQEKRMLTLPLETHQYVCGGQFSDWALVTSAVIIGAAGTKMYHDDGRYKSQARTAAEVEQASRDHYALGFDAGVNLSRAEAARFK